MQDICLVEGPFDPAERLREFETAICSGAEAGAIVSFTGRVRAEAAPNEVLHLHLQAYQPLTVQGIRQAADKALSRWSLVGLCVTHRVGDIGPGEAIVFVAAASRHRRSAFEAADFMMDYLKTEALFWKQQTTTSGHQWIEPRAEDYSDMKRWSSQGK